MPVMINNRKVFTDDLYYTCFIIEKTSRIIKQHNKYTVNKLGRHGLEYILCNACVLHCENPVNVAQDLIEDYHIEQGIFDIKEESKEMLTEFPIETSMRVTYSSLIMNTLKDNEDWIDGILKIYNSWLAEKIDDYRTGMYFDPPQSLVIDYLTGEIDPPVTQEQIKNVGNRLKRTYEMCGKDYDILREVGRL